MTTHDLVLLIIDAFTVVASLISVQYSLLTCYYSRKTRAICAVSVDRNMPEAVMHLNRARLIRRFAWPMTALVRSERLETVFMPKAKDQVDWLETFGPVH